MTTYQYIHPSCNLKKESDYTHISRSVDTNTCNPMTNELKSKLVPLTFNYNAEINFPLGVCNNSLLQIGPVREDHKEEQFWNNYQFKKLYPKKYNLEHTQTVRQVRKDVCTSGGRIGCTKMDNEQHPGFNINDINRPLAHTKGALANPVPNLGNNMYQNIL